MVFNAEEICYLLIVDDLERNDGNTRMRGSVAEVTSQGMTECPDVPRALGDRHVVFSDLSCFGHGRTNGANPVSYLFVLCSL